MREVPIDPAFLHTVAEGNSCGRICNEQPIHAPFLFEGEYWICIGSGSKGHQWFEAECFRVIDPAVFARRHPEHPARTYHKHDFHGELRAQWGSYHSMSVISAGRQVVLEGPPIKFVPGEATVPSVQEDLFA